MDINYVIEELKQSKIDLEMVCFNDNVKDDIFCVLDNYHRIEVFYRERGERYWYKWFLSEKDAVQYLIKIMK